MKTNAFEVGHGRSGRQVRQGARGLAVAAQALTVQRWLGGEQDPPWAAAHGGSWRVRYQVLVPADCRSLRTAWLASHSAIN